MSKFAAFALSLSAVVGGCAATDTAAVTSSPRTAASGCELMPSQFASAESLSAPFRVVDATRLTETVGRQRTGATAGARLVVEVEPGLGVVDVNRALRCRAASALAAGSTTDPLAVPSRRLAVEARGDHYVVTVTGANRDASQEIWARAEALAGR